MSAASPARVRRAGARPARLGSGSRRRGRPAACARCGAEPVAQLDGGERVEAEVPERPLDGYRVGPAWPSTAAAWVRTRSSSSRSCSGAAQAREPFGQGRPAAAVPGRPSVTARCWRCRTSGRPCEQRAGPGGGEGEGEAVPVDVGHDQRRCRPRRAPVRSASVASCRGHRRHAVPAAQFGHGFLAGHAAPGPGAPGDRGGGRPRPGGAGEGVEVGVGRRVVRPARAAPNVPAMEENRTNADRSRSRGQLVAGAHAAPALARSTAIRAGPVERVRARPSSSTAAVWTTAVSGCSSGTSASAAGQRVPVGDVAGDDGRPARRPRPVRRRSSAAPGASGPRRLVSTRCSAPRAASQRATWPPSAPVPPVTSTVPAGGPRRRCRRRGSGARDQPAGEHAGARTATWSSPARRRAAAAAGRRPARRDRRQVDQAAPAVGVFQGGDPAEPQTSAWPGRTGVAQRRSRPRRVVTHHSGASTPASPRPGPAQVCRRARRATAVAGVAVRPRASSDSTPLGIGVRAEHVRSWSASPAVASRRSSAATATQDDRDGAHAAFEAGRQWPSRSSPARPGRAQQPGAGQAARRRRPGTGVQAIR